MSLSRRLLASILLVCLAAGPSYAASKNGTEEKVKIKASPDANTSFTPLMLLEDAAQRGISLSGEAKLYRLEPGRYRLDDGCVLVHTEKPFVITTCRAAVTARKGATIVVSVKGQVTRVLNLSDRKRDSVRIIFGKNHLSLNPGEELAVASAGAENADKVAIEDAIRYRNVQKVVVCPKYVALHFEFSLVDAMRRYLIFRQLNESTREEDRLLLDEIMKTAAALDTMFEKSRGKYKRGEKVAVEAEGQTNPERKSKHLIRMRAAFKHLAAVAQGESR